MTANNQETAKSDSTSKVYLPSMKSTTTEQLVTREAMEPDPLQDLESSFDIITDKHPRLSTNEGKNEARSSDLKALLEISKAVNSTLVLDDILQIVMRRAIELLQAERGFLMLLDSKGKLQFKTVYNPNGDSLPDEDLKISNSIANEVVRTGKPVFASDAQADERFAKQQSILELHLRSIMCVPLKVKERILGVVYLDNSSDAKIFLQSDLYLFELFAEQAAIAVENAKLYESLLDLKRYNENVVDKTPVGIVVTDADLMVTSLNAMAASILAGDVSESFNYDPSSAMKSFESYWPEEKQSHWERITRQVMDTGESYCESKYYHQIGDDQKVLSIKVRMLYEGEGDGSGLIVVIEDITDKIILENYVLMSERLVAKGEMAASIGHELNNYLTIISNNAELLGLNVRKKKLDRLEKNANSILDNIQKIKRFTDSLMDYSKLEAEIVDYDVKSLIEELLFSLRPQKSFKHIDVEVEVPPNLPAVQMDVGQMHQVLLNLVNNAIEAIEPTINNKGRISISVRCDAEQNEVSIEVADNGPGIAAGNLEKIFEPRFTTKKDGHGLGLANCRRIVESHHGKITAISEEPEGSIFRLVMPIRQPEEETE